MKNKEKGPAKNDTKKLAADIYPFQQRLLDWGRVRWTGRAHTGSFLDLAAAFCLAFPFLWHRFVNLYFAVDFCSA